MFKWLKSLVLLTPVEGMVPVGVNVIVVEPVSPVLRVTTFLLSHVIMTINISWLIMMIITKKLRAMVLLDKVHLLSHYLFQIM